MPSPCVDSQRIATANEAEMAVALDKPPVLPLELLVLVAEFLAGDDSYETLANFSSTCAIVRAETLPVFCETMILLPDSTASQGNNLSAVCDFVKEQRKHVRYLTHDNQSSDLFTFDLPNIRVQISCNKDASSSRASLGSSMYGYITILLGGIVSATTLDHLIHLCRMKRGENCLRLIDPPRMKVQGVEVLSSGRIVGVQDIFSTSWYFHHQGQYLDLTVDGNTQGLKETMRYLYGGFSRDDPNPPNSLGTQRSWIKISLQGDISAFDVFVDSLENLLHRCSVVAPTITLQASRVTVDQVQTRMQALAVIYANNWSRMASSLQQLRDNNFLHINIENDAGFVDMPSIGEWLHFGVDDAAERGRLGVTFVLVDPWVRYLWEETYSCLRMPEET